MRPIAWASDETIALVRTDRDAGMDVEYIADKYRLWPTIVEKIINGTYTRTPRGGNKNVHKEPELPSLKSIMEAIFSKKRERIIELEERIKELEDELSGLESDQDYQAAKAYLAQTVRTLRHPIGFVVDAEAEKTMQYVTIRHRKIPFSVLLKFVEQEGDMLERDK